MKKEKWIENVMGSSKGLNSLEPIEHLFQKIQSRIDESSNYVFSRNQIIGIAAGILVLVSVNLSMIISKSSQVNEEQGNTLVEQFDSTGCDKIYSNL
jgi:hypothetical protein